MYVYTDQCIKHVPCQTPDTADQFTSQPVATRWATLLTPPSPSCRDERWTYMYKVDHAAAAAFHLVLHSAGGLHMFDQASQPAVDTVAGCSSQPNGSQHLNGVITNSRCSEARYSEFPVLQCISSKEEGH